MAVDELIERLRAVQWEEADDCSRMPDDPTHKCVFVDMRPAEFEALLTEAAAALGLAARLVDELDGLVGESYGVSGLHLNGDVATWDELLPGGRFERLSSLDELRAALAAQQQGGAA